MKWNADRVLSITALAVAVGTLVFIVYQSILMRETARASVLPYLQLSYGQVSNQQAFINLVNTGVGPAFIERVSIELGDTLIDGDPYDLYLQLFPGPEHQQGVYIDKIIPGMVVPAGRDLRVLGTTTSPRVVENINDTFAILGLQQPGEENPGRAVIIIDYQSVYGQHWRIRSDSAVPRAL